MKETTKVGQESSAVTLVVAGFGFGIALDQVKTQDDTKTVVVREITDGYYVNQDTFRAIWGDDTTSPQIDYPTYRAKIVKEFE